jgi:serine/tyrosine/threonine adenylyltransferase
LGLFLFGYIDSLKSQMFNSVEFDNRMLSCLPVDRMRKVFPRRVTNAIFSQSTPDPVSNPKLIAIAADALRLLGADCPSDNLTAEQQADVANFLSGNKLLRKSRPHAHCYCGYQFGIFAGQLGDGAAISLGEVVRRIAVPAATGRDGPMKALERNELQIKGAGVTPYSRK